MAETKMGKIDAKKKAGGLMTGGQSSLFRVLFGLCLGIHLARFLD